MINTNAVCNQLVTADFLKYLLSKNTIEAIPDFRLTAISKVYLYPLVKSTPFAEPCDYLSQLMESNSQNKQYSELLKSISNVFIGQWAQSPKFPQNYLLEKNDFNAISQWKDFIAAEALTSDICLVKKKPQQIYSNQEQNQFAVTLKGREIFLKCIVAFSHYLCWSLKSCNCDGFLTASTKTLVHNSSIPDIFMLDQWLLSNLSKKSITQYVELKFMYFSKPQVCPTHLNAYIMHLINKKQFIPYKCCTEYTSEYTNNGYKLKMESFGTQGFVIAKNKSLTIDSKSHTATVKCSGLKGKDIHTFLNSCGTNVQQLFQNLLSSN